MPTATPQERESSCDDGRATHIVLLASAGMGHLIPCLRLAAELYDRGCHVSLITTYPTVSAAESRHIEDFLAAFPGVRPLELHIPSLDLSEFETPPDPFFLRIEAIIRSAHLLPPLLANASPPVSAVVIDVSVASSFVPTVTGMGIPGYVLFISCAAMLSLCAYFPTYVATKTKADVGDVEIPSVGRVPRSNLPPALYHPGHLFTRQFVANGEALPKANGIFVNTFRALEPEALAALNQGQVVPDLPPVLAIGPLRPFSRERGSASISWLDTQPERSVLYVSFGSRSAMSAEQMKELGSGLEKSGCRFLWVVRSKVVDREEAEEVGLEAMLSEGYVERVKGRGMVVRGWVEQGEILTHRAVGGFLSHAGWNSVTEAARYGVRMLAWPVGGDQRINAEVVAGSGLGLWRKEWKWLVETEAVPVGAEEISENVRELMTDEGLRASAEKLGEEAIAAVGVGGSSYNVLEEFMERLKV